MKIVVLSLLVLAPLPLQGRGDTHGIDTESARLLERAEGGDTTAQFLLGRAYHRGEGVKQDLQAAAMWLKRAAESGETDAIESMGFLHATGQGVSRDEAEAVRWFRRAADAGSTRAKLNLGLLLRKGRGVQSSNEESLRLMREAAEAGSPEAQSYLAQLYFMGDRLQPPDAEKAVIYAKKAAEAGDAAAQNIMGLLSRDGIGPSAKGKDPVQAEQWFRQAAMRNEVKAQANLAHLMGVASVHSTNRVEALKWLLLAKDRNEPTAQKTYNEISPTLSPDLEKRARKLAARFLLEQPRSQGSRESPEETEHSPPTP